MTATADLSRFTAAQDPVWDGVMDELHAGRKTGHWMWFVFPQLAALGRSPTARHYGIADLDEARAYVAHPVLGPRLAETARALLGHSGTPAEAILGSVDALKLRSSATLMDRAGGGPEQAALLDAFYAGAPDPLTLEHLG